MFPRYFRWLALVGVLASLVVFITSGMQVFIGTLAITELVKPLVMATCFGWMFTQSTKA